MNSSDDLLLKVDDLSVAFKTKKGMAEAVRGISLEVSRGESLAVVGESGSGKSVSMLALLNLLPASARIQGSALLGDTQLVGLDAKSMRSIRGRRIAMIFQDPMTAFNPVYTVGRQISETIEAHGTASSSEAMRRAIDLLELVGVPEPAQRVRQYPHEFSGGMRQRAMIAMAIANSPDLLIADEPTTALDVTIQAQVLDVLKDIRAETGAAMILITHDLGVVAGSADRVQVMYGGRVFERGTVDDVFHRPENPYTRGLLASMPRLDSIGGRLEPIPGTPPSVLNMPVGCAFSPRCTYRVDRCLQEPAQLQSLRLGHDNRCHLSGQLPDLVGSAASSDPGGHNDR
ncbi:MAG: ABC transporter ATP-binding protein [Actinomycetota bacterium]